MPTLQAASGLDYAPYREAVLARFRNAPIVHRLDQIAADGNHKIHTSWTNRCWRGARRAAGEMLRHAVAALGCWVASLFAAAVRRHRHSGSSRR